MIEGRLTDILNEETMRELDKLARLQELCQQLIIIETELRSDYNVGLEIIELDHV